MTIIRAKTPQNGGSDKLNHRLSKLDIKAILTN